MTIETKNSLFHFILLVIKNHYDYEIINNKSIQLLFGEQLATIKDHGIKNCLDLINIKYISTTYTSFFELKNTNFCHTTTINFLKLYNKTNHNELLYAMLYDNKKQDLYANFTECCLYFDNLAFLVPTVILSYNQVDQIKAINKFINIAYKYKKVRNYHLLFAIMAGICNTNISRLPYLQISNKKMDSLTKIIDPSRNFENYNNEISKQDEYIPYFGIIMRDIKFALEDNICNENEINKNSLLKINNHISKYKNIHLSGSYTYEL